MSSERGPVMPDAGQTTRSLYMLYQKRQTSPNTLHTTPFSAVRPALLPHPKMDYRSLPYPRRGRTKFRSVQFTTRRADFTRIKGAEMTLPSKDQSNTCTYRYRSKISKYVILPLITLAPVTLSHASTLFLPSTDFDTIYIKFQANYMKKYTYIKPTYVPRQ